MESRLEGENIQVKKFNTVFFDIKKFEDQSNPFSILLGDITDKKTENISFEDLVDNNKTFLNEVGLSINKNLTGGFTRINGKEIPDIEIKININDSEKFKSFIKSLPSGENKLYLGLEKIGKSMIDQLRGITKDALTREIRTQDKYDLNSLDDDRMVNFFSSVETIIYEYNRLDATPDKKLLVVTQSLEKYLEVSRAGYLREYILAENTRLIGLENIKSGLSPNTCQWTLSFFKQKWDAIFDVLLKIKDNDSTKDFLHEIITDLTQAQLSFKKDLEVEKERLKHLSDQEELNKRWSEWEETLNKYLEELINYQ